MGSHYILIMSPLTFLFWLCLGLHGGQHLRHKTSKQCPLSIQTCSGKSDMAMFQINHIYIYINMYISGLTHGRNTSANHGNSIGNNASPGHSWIRFFPGSGKSQIAVDFQIAICRLPSWDLSVDPLRRSSSNISTFAVDDMFQPIFQSQRTAYGLKPPAPWWNIAIWDLPSRNCSSGGMVIWIYCTFSRTNPPHRYMHY